MSLAQRITTGALRGGLFGAAIFLADLAAAFAVDGEEFHASPAGFLLLAIFGMVAVVPAALLGATVGAFWRRAPGAAPRTRLVRAALLGAAVLVLAAGFFVRGGGAREPRAVKATVRAEHPAHVLWIVIDTLRADTLYGDDLDFPVAPGLRRLADESVLFREAEAPSGWTIPSTASLLTGIYPTTLGAERGLLPNWAPTAAETLREAGYRTHAVVDNALLGRKNGFAAGFETYSRRSALEFAWSLLPRRLLTEGILSWLSFELPITYCGADVVTDEALRIVDAHRDEDPLLLYVHYMDVHTPFRPHPELGTAPSGAEDVPLQYSAFRARIRHDRAALRDGQLSQMEFLYRNELAFVDLHAARLLERFDARFGRENTLVIVTADHGEEFYEHGSFGHGYTVYSELVNVPLLARFPSTAGVDEKRGAVVAAPVSLVDVLPTTLDVLGIAGDRLARPLPLQGRSLLPLVRGDATFEPAPLFGAQNRFDRRLHRWRRGNDVYVTTAQGKGEETSELFHLAQDPNEQQDLSAAHPDLAREMARQLAEFLKAQLAARDPEAVTTDDNLDAIEALGYGGK